MFRDGSIAFGAWLIGLIGLAFLNRLCVGRPGAARFGSLDP